MEWDEKRFRCTFCIKADFAHLSSLSDSDVAFGPTGKFYSREELKKRDSHCSLVEANFTLSTRHNVVGGGHGFAIGLNLRAK
mmetsp:Transcript_33352/g.55171  ORF Transcript_33352/g.55171 Transcript_33352/m.55171 type:complete len:82 (-) Transcript_33352:1050-1295(-)